MFQRDSEGQGDHLFHFGKFLCDGVAVKPSLRDQSSFRVPSPTRSPSNERNSHGYVTTSNQSADGVPARVAQTGRIAGEDAPVNRRIFRRIGGRGSAGVSTTACSS